jgi:hypothetical protein
MSSDSPGARASNGPWTPCHRVFSRSVACNLIHTGTSHTYYVSRFMFRRVSLSVACRSHRVSARARHVIGLVRLRLMRQIGADARHRAGQFLRGTPVKGGKAKSRRPRYGMRRKLMDAARALGRCATMMTIPCRAKRGVGLDRGQGCWGLISLVEIMTWHRLKSGLALMAVRTNGRLARRGASSRIWASKQPQ